MEKRSVLQKVVLISVAAMAVAFAILTFVFHRLEGVKFEEGFLRVSAQADDPAATVYAGKIQGERVKITVTDCPDEQRTAVEVQVGDRVRDECVVETGLPPIQADQLGPVEHIRITRNGQLLFEGGYTAVKLYFMLGLPTETDADLEGIAELGQKIVDLYYHQENKQHDMGWYDLEGNWDPFYHVRFPIATLETITGSIMKRIEGRFSALPEGRAGELGRLDAVFSPCRCFRPAGAGRRIPIGPVPSPAYVRREGPGAVGLLSGKGAGWCIYPILSLIGYNIALRVPP